MSPIRRRVERRHSLPRGERQKALLVSNASSHKWETCTSSYSAYEAFGNLGGDFRLLFWAIRTRLQSRLFLFVARKIVSWAFLSGDLKPDSRERLRGWHTLSP